jgi:ankyrin repeat protein
MTRLKRFHCGFFGGLAMLGVLAAVGCKEQEAPPETADPATTEQPVDPMGDELDTDLISELGPDEPAEDDPRTSRLDERALVGQIELNTAAAKGDLDKIKELLTQPVPVPVNDHKGDTPIHYAAMTGHVDVMEHLLGRGFDPNAANRENVRPIHWAAFGGQREAMRLLLDHGADVEAMDNHGRTPLFAAAHGGNVEVIQLLLDRGAHVNLIDGVGDTPLIVATSQGRVEAVRELIKAGAHVDEQDRNGQTALFRAVDLCAVHPRFIAIVEALIIGDADLNIPDNRGWSPTDIARRTADIPLYELLRSHGGQESRVTGPPLSDIPLPPPPAEDGPQTPEEQPEVQVQPETPPDA